MKKKEQQFKKERKQTDDSLTLERGKTDESISIGRGDTHTNTDELVSKNRIEADEIKLQRRDAADQERENSATDLVSSEKVSKVFNHALERQRKSEDKSIENERLNMDTALKTERIEKEKLINKIVTQERAATDRNLKGERVVTDLATERSATLLSEVQAAHAETKSALTTREEFVAIVSHDLRNPIGAIRSSAEILLKGTAKFEISAEVKNLVQLIKRNADTSLRLISDILDMERIVEGKLQLQLTENRINDLIRESVESFAYAADEKKISLSISPSIFSNAMLFDKDRVAQILSNLIGNALKFTPSGGTVTVEARQTESEVTVSIRDTGPGIPDDQKSRIFERFTQIGDEQRAGLGLGLYISKTLVESHLGKIWVASKLGEGSTFWFTLPVV